MRIHSAQRAVTAAVFAIVLLLSGLAARGQQLRVASMKPGLEPMYSSMERRDNNGEICALVKFQFPRPGLEFEGHIVGEVSYRKGEYWVYFIPGAKLVRVKGDGYYATDVVDIRPLLNGGVLEGNRVYIGRIEADGGVEEKPALQTHNYLIVATVPAVAGATVTLDGRTFFTDASGAMQVYLPLGSYPYRIAAGGYEEVAGTAIVTPGDAPAELRVGLRSIMGRMMVNSPTEGAEVYVNNIPQGRVPLELALAEGTYRVELRKDGFRAASRDVEVGREKVSKTDFPALEALTGAINVAYAPTYATVTIDGRAAGKSPRIFRDIPVGRHTVTVSYPGFSSRTHLVTVYEGATAELSGSLEKASASAPASAAAPASAPAPDADKWRTVGRNLDLAVSRDGRNYFFSEDEWGKFSKKEADAFRKLGIVIDNDGQRFMWSLTDNAKKMNWHKAVKRFGDRLPSKRQCEAMASQYTDVYRAIVSYGGDDPAWGYWTRDEKDAAYAWYFDMYYGSFGYLDKSGANGSSRVRTVSPVPAAQ